MTCDEKFVQSLLMQGYVPETPQLFQCASAYDAAAVGLYAKAWVGPRTARASTAVVAAISSRARGGRSPLEAGSTRTLPHLLGGIATLDVRIHPCVTVHPAA